MPKVSVIIPVYGVEQYIERCVRSLFEQTLDDIEYLFIDDRTPDNSIEILMQVLEDYPRRKRQVVIHSMEQNSGQAAVRKWGILNATGEYIIHCDSDDWVDVTMYEKLYNRALEDDADFVWCDYYNTDGIRYVYKSLNYSTKKEECIKGLIRQKVWWSCCNKIIRRSIYQNGIIYPVYNAGEDFALTLQLAYYCNKFSYLNEALYYYYYNSNSITLRRTIEQIEYNVISFTDNIRIVEQFYDTNGAYPIIKYDLTGLKIFAKKPLMGQSNNSRGRMLWKCIYPELTIIEVLWCKYVSIYTKLLYVLTSIGLYNSFRNIKHKLLKPKNMR